MPPKQTSAKQQRLTPSNIIHMTLDSLRQQLRARNLSSAGNKKALAERLRTHLAPIPMPAKLASASESTPANLLENVDDGRTLSRAASRNGTAAANARQRERRVSREGRQHRQPRGGQRRQSNPDQSSGRSGDDYHSPHPRYRSRSPIATPSDNQSATCRHQTLSRRAQKHYRSRSGSQSQLSITSSGDSSVSPAPEKHTRYKRRRRSKHKKKHRTRRRSSSTSSESSTSTSSLSSQSSSNQHRRHRRRKHYHTHASLRDRLPSRTKAKLQRLAVSCCPPLPEKYSTRIARGEYVSSDKLAIPEKRHDKHPSKRSGKVVSDLASWLEAWNTTALRNYQAEACIDYDRRFRELAAKDKTLAWGKYKEDIFYGVSHQSPQTLTRLIPFASASQESWHDWAQPLTQSPTLPQEQKSVCVSTQPGVALKVALVNSSTCATKKGVKGSTQPVSAPPNTSPLKRIITPLRRLQFKAELRSHENPAWVQELLKEIDNGVSLGYHGQRCQRVSHNLVSGFKHPHVIDKELSEETSAQRIAGPFDIPPLPNLQCSGVRVVPKKTGGWRIIMHLSAPVETSINNGINKEEFTLHYSTIDDAVRMINKLGKNTLLAKVDIKSAFRTIPVRQEDRELLEYTGSKSITLIAVCPLACAPHPSSLISMRKSWSGFCVATIKQQKPSTTLMTF